MEEIGRRLQAARVAKGITLEEVEEETRIRKKYIEALESGRTAVIPGEVYVKGFLRTYGNFLGLDGEALVKEYKALKNRQAGDVHGDGADAAGRHRAEAPERHAEEEVAAASPESSPVAHAPRPPAFVQVPRRSGRSRAKRRQRGPGPGVYLVRRIAVALVILLPLAGLGYWLWNRPAGVAQNPPTDAVVQESDPSQQAAEPDPEPEPEPESETPQEPPEPVVTVSAPQGEDVAITVAAPAIDLEMNFGAGTWLEVYNTAGETLYWAKAEGKVSFQGDGFRVRLGNVNSFSLTINGEPVDHGLKGGPYTLSIKKTE